MVHASGAAALCSPDRIGLGVVSRNSLRAVLLAAVCLSVASPAFANDFAFGGAASDLVPLEETRVQMVSEDILIEYGRTTDLQFSYRQRWDVTASYVFKNSTDQPVTLQVGFPEFRCDEFEPESCNRNAFQGLRTTVAGMVVQHRKGALNKKHAWATYLGVVWIYEVTFPPQREVKIQHQYSVAESTNSNYAQSVAYVTRTGAQWASDIGNARFTFRLPSSTHAVMPPRGIPMTSLRLVEPDGPDPYVEVICEQRNWNPTQDLWLMFSNVPWVVLMNLGEDALTRSGISADDLCEAAPRGTRKSDIQHQMCINDVYACAGYPFKNEKLSRYYYGNAFTWRQTPFFIDPNEHWWIRGVRPFPQFKPEWLNEDAREILKWMRAERFSIPETEKMPPNGSATQLPQPEVKEPTAAVSVSSAAKAPENAPTSSRPTDDTNDANSREPQPVRTRAGSCGCKIANDSNASLSSLLILMALAWRRRPRR